MTATSSSQDNPQVAADSAAEKPVPSHQETASQNVAQATEAEAAAKDTPSVEKPKKETRAQRKARQKAEKEEKARQRRIAARQGGRKLFPTPTRKQSVAFIVVLAWMINKERPRGLGRFPALLKYVVLTGVFAGSLAVLSSDWGMVIVYLFIFVIMAWVAGVSKWWFIGVGTPMVGLVVFLWKFILPRTKYWTDYRIMRFRVVLDHDLDPLGRGWQQSRSLLAIGSGQLTGMGWLKGTQTQSLDSTNLPARHTDNIFAVCGEEFGLIGCCAVLLVLLLIILRCVWVSRRAKSYMSAYIAMGIAAMLMIQTIINVAMCLYVGPVIGLTLPFFSYGGSSTLTLFIAMGLVSGIKMRPLPSWLKDRSQL